MGSTKLFELPITIPVSLLTRLSSKVSEEIIFLTGKASRWQALLSNLMKLIMDCSLNLICFFFTSLLSSRAFLLQCEARSMEQQPERLMHMEDVRDSKTPEMKTVKHLDSYYSSSDPYYFMGSPLNLPPYDGAAALSPSFPLENPPFCIYPYLPPPPPPSAATNPGSPEFPVPNPPDYVPSPPGFGSNPPNPPTLGPGSPDTNLPNPPMIGPGPPVTNLPNPPMIGPGPPGYGPSPPSIVPAPPSIIYVPKPPGSVPEPPIFVPGPPIFLPPIIYPSRQPPPPPVGLSIQGVWCLAKPTVPDPIIQEALDYACGSGADCEPIQPTGSCFEPDTVVSHASYAFNSYFQRTKVAGGTCDFGGTAILVTKDPSYDGCLFITV